MANDLDTLSKAFYKAKESGDTANARKFAQAIVDQKSSNSPPAKRMGAIDTLTGQLKNIPSSGVRLAENMTYPIRHPVDFSNSATNLAKGAYQKFTDGVQPQERHVDDIVSFAKDRWGGMDNLAKTAYDDPLGAAADVVGMVAMRPIVRATKNAKKITGSLSDAIDRTIYSDSYPADSYKKVAKTSYEQKNLDKNINTALEEKIMPSAEGLERRQALMNEIDTTITRMIDEATSNGGSVSVQSVMSDVPDLKADIGSGLHADGGGNIIKANRVVDKILAASKSEGRTQYSVADLQKLKRNLYKEASFDINQSKADNAVNLTRKNIANNAKEQIEGFVPEVKGLNQRYGGLIDADKSMTRTARRVDGLNNIGIGSPIQLMGGASLGAPFMASNPALGSAISGVGAAAALTNAYRMHPKRLAKRAIRVNQAKKGNLKQEMGRLNLLSQLEKKGIPLEMFVQGLLQTSRQEGQNGR